MSNERPHHAYFLGNLERTQRCFKANSRVRCSSRRKIKFSARNWVVAGAKHFRPILPGELFHAACLAFYLI
jgi:hypothetical protein